MLTTSPIRRLLVPIALIAIVALQGLDLAAWFALDELPARSICCDLSGDAAQAVSRVHRQGAGPTLPWEPAQGLLPELGRLLFDWTGATDAFQWVVGLGSLVLALALFDIGRQLGGAWAGVLAAALVPLTPTLAFASRRWDAQGPLGALIAVGIAAVVRSRGLTRPLPTLVVAGVGVLIAVISPRETDNLLALATLGVVVGAAAVRTIATRRGPLGAKANPAAAIGGLVAVGVLVVAGAAVTLNFSSPEGAAYYLTEIGGGESRAGTVGGIQGMFAYTTHLFWRGLTPWIAAPAAAATVLFAVRGRGRAELLAWALVPLVALSLLPKRNFYYLSVMWPVVPILMALGLRALPGPAALRGGLAAALLAVGLVQHLDRAFPGTSVDPIAADHSWLTGTKQWGGAFQTHDGDLDLAPGDAGWVDPIAGAVSRAITADTCRCRSFVLTVGDLDWDQLGMRLLQDHRCIELRRVEGAPRDGTVVAAVGDDWIFARLPAAQAAHLSHLTVAEVVPVPQHRLVVMGLSTPASQPCAPFP